MKRVVPTIPIVFAAVIAAQSSAQSLKIACIDMEKVFQGYYLTFNANKNITRQTEIFKDYAKLAERERFELEENYKRVRNESQNIAYTDDHRAQKRREAKDAHKLLQEKIIDIQEYERDQRKILRDQYEKARENIVEEIKEKISSISKSRSYDLVLDVSGKTMNAIPAVVYYHAKYEITEEILAMLNEGHEEQLKELTEGNEEKEEKETEN